MKKMHQQGFTIIEALLVIIALCLIVGVGYYIYNSNHTKNTATTTANKTDNSSKALPPSAKKYLVIKELGIKFELTDSLKNAYYGKVGDYYYLSVHDFDSNPELSGCAVNSAKDELGILAITVGTVGGDNGTPSGGTWTQAELDASGMQKVGDIHYGFQAGNGPCYDPTTVNAETNANTVGDFKHAFVLQQSTITKL